MHDAGEDDIALGRKHFARHHDAQRINARRQVLKGHAVLLKRLQNLAPEAQLAVHHRLFNADDREALAPRNAGDGGVQIIMRRVQADNRARMRRVVGVADVGGNTRLVHGEHGVLMQDGRAHIGQFTQLLVSDGADFARMRHNARVSHQETRHVRPVLVHAGFDRAGDNRARDIRAAARERLNCAVRIAAIEARHDRRHAVGQLLRHQRVRRLRVKRAVRRELDRFRRVHEPPAHEIRQQQAVQVLAAGGAVIRVCPRVNLFVHFVQRRAQIHMQTEFLRNVHVARGDQVKRILIILARRLLLVAAVEQVCHLVVVLEAAARRRGNHILPRFVQQQNILYFAELSGIRQ